MSESSGKQFGGVLVAVGAALTAATPASGVEAKITVRTLHGSDYALDAGIRAGHTLTTSQPFPISFDPAALTELD